MKIDALSQCAVVLLGFRKLYVCRDPEDCKLSACLLNMFLCLVSLFKLHDSFTVPYVDDVSLKPDAARLPEALLAVICASISFAAFICEIPICQAIVYSATLFLIGTLQYRMWPPSIRGQIIFISFQVCFHCHP